MTRRPRQGARPSPVAGRATLIALGGLLAALVLQATPTRAEQPVDLALVVQRLETRLSELVDTRPGALLDSLYFGWFDQPYERATLAITVRTVELLKQEVAARQQGARKLTDTDVERLVAWTDEALNRVRRPRQDDDFRPNRVRITLSALLDRQNDLLPLLGVLLSQEASTSSAAVGEFDLLVSLGFRAVGIPTGSSTSRDNPDRLRERADALGVALVDVDPSGRDVPAPISEPPTWQSVPMNSLVSQVFDVGEDGTAYPSLSDPTGGESLASSLARRALWRGAIGRAFPVAVWKPPLRPPQAPDSAAWIPLTIRIHAAEGQALTFLEGWSPPVANSTQPSAGGNLTFDPEALEAAARCSLGLLQNGERIRAFMNRPYLAVAVGPDAMDPNDKNRWADWTEPVWEGLLDLQVPFDVISSAAMQGRSASQDYDLVFQLERPATANPELAFLRLKYKLAVLPGYMHRLTARDASGLVADRVWIRANSIADGRSCVALANLTGMRRTLRLRGGPALGSMLDLRTGEEVLAPSDGVVMEPWQLRILWPNEE
ncbi:MAG: hypothetical protein JSV78_05100 [Phycisphaerales bacterium]|nr:MAG: hypothetical protein JSV78_05100 [Phycisphaerales bacterium]